MLPLALKDRIRRHCLSPGMEIPIREWETANGYLAGSEDAHAALKGRKVKYCYPASPSSRRDAEAAALDSQFPKDRDTGMNPPYEMNVEAVRSHSRAVAEWMATVKTRAKSAGSAKRRMDRKPGVSGEDVGRIAVVAAVVVPGAGHCWERKGGSWSGTRRQRTGAAESGTGRCMAERPS